MTIAISGSTGQLGRLVVAKLVARGHGDIIALARDPAKGADLGVEVRKADYEDPATLGPALRGVDTLLLISGSEVGRRLPHHKNVIDAARDAGVKRIVYTSLLRADTSPLSLADEHKATEQLLADSGLAVTVLRNAWYIENHTGNLGAALQAGAVYGAAGEGRFSAATREDFAEAAAVVLTTPGHEGKTYELSGDESYTLGEYAAELSRQTGKSIPYTNLSQADYAAALAQAGLPEPFAQGLAAWDVDASKGALFDDGHQLRELIGRPTTSLHDALARALAAS